MLILFPALVLQTKQFNSILLHSSSASPYSCITWHRAKTQIIWCESTINPDSSSAKPESQPPTPSRKPAHLQNISYSVFHFTLSFFPLLPFSHIRGVGVKSKFRAIPVSQAIYTSSNPLPHIPTRWLHHHHHHDHLPLCSRSCRVSLLVSSSWEGREPERRWVGGCEESWLTGNEGDVTV